MNLVQVDNGVFDLSFSPSGNGAAYDAVSTLIYAVLFTDQVAPTSVVPDVFNQRGWWNDPQAGSGLWYVRRQGLSSDVQDQAINMIQTALAAHSTALTNVVVTLDEGASAGNPSSVFVNITGEYYGVRFIFSTGL